MPVCLQVERCNIIAHEGLLNSAPPLTNVYKLEIYEHHKRLLSTALPAAVLESKGF
jgi:hypothetical protein